MGEYVWPDLGDSRDHAEAAQVWPETLRALPAGTPVAAEVIGRQPFGVFLRFEDHPDAIGHAEITAMPNCGCLELPDLGARVTGVVIWHAEHNFQVKVRLDAWTRHLDDWSEQVNALGQNILGTVTMPTPFGVFVRISDCVQGLIPAADLPEPDTDARDGFREGQRVSVRLVEMDLIQGRVRLVLSEDSS